MINQDKEDLAARSLETLIQKGDGIKADVRRDILEQSYVLMGKLLADRLDCREAAVHTFKVFLARYPNSKARLMVESRLEELEMEPAA